MTKKLLVPAILVALAVAPAAHADGGLFKLDPGVSWVSYKIVHKFHEVVGTSKHLDGAALVKGGELQVQIRSAIAAFDSGNANRDSHMKETVDEAKYPYVVLKGVIHKFAVPSSFPATLQAQLDGQLNFHGETHPISVPVTLTFASADRVHATTAFDVSLDAYHVPRPSLMFIKIEDACRITADVQMAR